MRGRLVGPGNAEDNAYEAMTVVEFGGGRSVELRELGNEDSQTNQSKIEQIWVTGTISAAFAYITFVHG